MNKLDIWKQETSETWHLSWSQEFHQDHYDFSFFTEKTVAMAKKSHRKILNISGPGAKLCLFPVVQEISMRWIWTPFTMFLDCIWFRFDPTTFFHTFSSKVREKIAVAEASSCNHCSAPTQHGKDPWNFLSLPNQPEEFRNTVACVFLDPSNQVAWGENASDKMKINEDGN